MAGVDLASATQDIVDRLTRAGLRAALDERDLNPPAVIVQPPALTYRFGRGADASWTAHAVVPNTGRGPALRALGELVDRVVAALGGLPVQGRPFDLLVPEFSAPLPAYELTWTARIPQSND